MRCRSSFPPSSRAVRLIFQRSIRLCRRSSFCPTGGITAENAPSYLKLSNVITIGGSWMAPKDLVAVKDWAGITRLAEAVARLKP